MRLKRALAAAAMSTALVTVPATGALAGSVPPPPGKVTVTKTVIKIHVNVKVTISNFKVGTIITFFKLSPTGGLSSSGLKPGKNGSISKNVGFAKKGVYHLIIVGTGTNGEVVLKNITITVK